MVHSLHVHFRNDKRNIFRLSFSVTVWKETRLLLNSDSSRGRSCSAGGGTGLSWKGRTAVSLFTFIYLVLYYVVLNDKCDRNHTKAGSYAKSTQTCFPKSETLTSSSSKCRYSIVLSITWQKGNAVTKQAVVSTTFLLRIKTDKKKNLECCVYRNQMWIEYSC